MAVKDRNQRQTPPWGKVVGLALSLAVVGIVTNESLLRAMGHRPSIVSDERLWALTYDKFIDIQDQSSIVLLGASRMQGNISLKEVRKVTGIDQVLQLALSGRGSSLAIFQQIVDETEFNGLIVISETEATLVGDFSQRDEVVRQFESRPLDANLNRSISNLLESCFVFLNPESSSYRLWGNLLLQGEPPEAFHVTTMSDREQSLDFSRTDVERVNHLRRATEGKREANGADPDAWIASVEQRWGATIQQFQARGGVLYLCAFQCPPNEASRRVYCGQLIAFGTR